MGSKIISTHTLTWSVTGDKLWDFVAGINFNSHAHVERDEFQFLIGHERFNFNSHAHVERDMVLLSRFVNTAISTHTLTWSVTA